MKKTNCFLKIFIMLITIIFCVPSYASTSLNTNTPENVLEKYVSALNENDWVGLIGLSADEDYDENVKFFSSKSNIDANIGFHAVNNAVISSVAPLNNKILYDYTNADYYFDMYGEDLTLFLVGVELSVEEESQYFYNGLNFFLVTLAKESEQWKVVLFSQAPASIIESNIQIRSNDVTKALEIINSRYNGVIIGSDGNVIETNIATPEQLLEEKSGIDSSSEDTAITLRANSKTRPSTIKVYLVDDDEIVTVDFYDYCKDVLPKEWYASWHEESLKAGAQAVKFVGWYRVYNAKYPGQGFDVKDTVADQHYVEGSAHSNTTAAINAVGGIGMQNSSNEIFYPSYRAGSEGQIGTQSSGIMQQWGSKELADEGDDYDEILSYYYSNSNVSSGNIKTFSY